MGTQGSWNLNSLVSSPCSPIFGPTCGQVFAEAGRENACEQPAQVSACLAPGTELKAKVKKHPEAQALGHPDKNLR